MLGMIGMIGMMMKHCLGMRTVDVVTDKQRVIA
jgi:hypothetical protein